MWKFSKSKKKNRNLFLYAQVDYTHQKRLLSLTFSTVSLSHHTEVTAANWLIVYLWKRKITSSKWKVYSDYFCNKQAHHQCDFIGVSVISSIANKWFVNSSERYWIKKYTLALWRWKNWWIFIIKTCELGNVWWKYARQNVKLRGAISCTAKTTWSILRFHVIRYLTQLLY